MEKNLRLPHYECSGIAKKHLFLVEGDSTNEEKAYFKTILRGIWSFSQTLPFATENLLSTLSHKYQLKTIKHQRQKRDKCFYVPLLKAHKPMRRLFITISN